MKNQPGPQFLGKTHHPAIGIRIPEIFLSGILQSYKKNQTAGGLMLSFGRETAPESVITAPSGEYPITLGHTGTSICQYQTLAGKKSKEAGIPVEIEADHLIVIGSTDRAVKRIAGVHTAERISPADLSKSLDYNFRAIDEAISTGYVNLFTTDTSDLFWLDVTELNNDDLNKVFESKIDPAERTRIMKTYSNQTFSFRPSDGTSFSLSLSERRTKELALRFWDSLNTNQQIFQYIKERLNDNFGFEISMDETADLTRPDELFFYLAEWTQRGLPVAYVAPNIGFHKRADYEGDLKELRNLVSPMAAIAHSFDNTLLCFHSGSGTSPDSGKGQGTYQALLSATANRLKYKISGVYFELLLELMANEADNSPERRIYERIFDEVLTFVEEELKQDGSLSSKLLEKQLTEYHNSSGKRDPRAAFLRFHSYLALNFRDKNGQRYFREAIIECYNKNPGFKGRVDAEVEALTDRLIQGLRFRNNFARRHCEA